MYSKIKKLCMVALIISLAVTCLFTHVFAAATGTHTPVTGVTVSVSGATDNSMSGDAVTVTAKGSGGLFGIGASAKTATVTVTNDSGSTATLSFDWTATSVNQLVIDGTTYSGAFGSFSKVMANDTSITITITTAKNSTVNKLVMSNFAVVPANASSNVTFNFDSTLGVVTLDGTAVTPDETKEVALAGGVIVAAPKGDTTFLGWVDAATGARLSTESTYTLTPASDMTVTAAFGKGTSTAWFLVDGAKLFNDLDVAAQKASSTIVLAADGTLPAGNYTIPSGVTLLIPYNTDHTLYTNNPELVIDNAAVVTPTAFRTLTLAEGANITIKGAMSLSGKVHAYMGGRYQNSAPTGPSGFVIMNRGSGITVDNGGTLYTWGYIVGNGEVIANNGGTVYECFQVRDWRGGDATSDMSNNGQRVFPVSQYYVQNIEVPLTLHYGATEKGFLATYVQRMKKTAEFTFIGSNGMFQLGENSTVTKRYDGTTDRLIIDIDGNMTVSSLVISIDTGIIGSVTLNSANYTLPINSNFTVNILPQSNVTISQDLALLPGAIINVEQGAKMTLGSGTKIFIYDKDQWGNYCVGSVQLRTVCWAYSRSYTRTAANLVDAQIVINGEVDASAGYIYTTSSGADICSTGSGIIKLTQGSDTKTYQATQADTTISYVEIPITTAQLKNGDGSYVETSSATSVIAYTYCPACLEWEYDGTGSVNHATNVELGNSLNMYFAFWGNDITTSSGHYVVVSHAGGNIPFTSDLWQTTSVQIGGELMAENAYVVYFKGLSAKQMGDVITVTLYDGGDKVVDTWSNSIQHYAMRMLSMHSDNETLRTLIVDMLNYGAACQKEFQYNTDNLVDAGLSAVQQGWATKEVAVENHSTSSDYHNSSNLVLAGNIQYVVAFNDSSKIAKIEYTFANHWYDGDNSLLAGEPVTRWEYHDGSATFSIRYLVVADARQIITITVYDKDGNKLDSWEDSIESYCARIINSADATDSQKDVCTTFMIFADSAEAYLEGGNRV